MRHLIGTFFKGLSFIISCLPNEVRNAIGDAIGLLWFDVFRIRRKVAIDNVGIAFPELSQDERTNVARSSLRHMGRTIVEYALLPFFDRKDVERFFDIEGLEHVESAM